MDMMNESCSRFLAELASKAPTPGGGGTAALVGAAGVALGNMVGCLTVGKKKYAAVEADILTLNERAGALRAELEALVQADAEAFAPLAAAYGLPKDTPEQAAHKAAVLETALDAACAVPLPMQLSAPGWRRSPASGRPGPSCFTQPLAARPIWPPWPRRPGAWAKRWPIPSAGKISA